MRKRTILIATAAVFMAVLLLVLTLYSRTRGGKLVSTYFEICSHPHTSTNALANIEQELIANASLVIPYLNDRISKREGPVSTPMRAFLKRHLPGKLAIYSADDSVTMASMGFKVLGTNAIADLPYLMTILSRADDWYSVGSAILATGFRCVPALTNAALSKSERLQYNAVRTLGFFEEAMKAAHWRLEDIDYTEVHVITPALVLSLDSSEAFAREAAVVSLIKLNRRHPDVALQALMKVVRGEKEFSVIAKALEGLLTLAPQSDSAIEAAISTRLNDAEMDIQAASSNALQKAGARRSEPTKSK